MDAVSEVKARLSIEDVVSEYVQLKRTGRNYKGLSPFTNEKTASFVVSPEKQIWHDFSSGRGGDIFTFVQEMEGLDFKGSLELLARKAGVDLDQFKSAGSGRPGIDKTRLQDALKLAVKFYQSHLLAKPEALEYILKKRGFSKQTMLDFQLGYSPDNQSALTDFLLKKGFKENELKLAGLITQRGGRNGDMFRGRIMIPLADSMGNTVGFTARLLEDNDRAPKYINTPSTPLYDKSRQLYGLHLAKQAIRENDYSIIVEGNLDVIASHQAGYKQVVASAGTAMTEYQLKTLSRFSQNVRLAFDQDRAGLEATERAIPIASKVGVDLNIITIPSGKDPDELIKKDPKLWEKAIADAEYAVDWIINTYRTKLDITTGLGKKKFSDELAKVIKDLTDPVEKDHYIQVVARMADIDADALRKKLSGAEERILKTRLKKPSLDIKLPPKEELDRIRTIDQLFCLSLMLPKRRNYLQMILPEMLANDSQRKIYKFLLENPDFDGDLKKLSKLEDISDYVKILVLQFEELYAKVDTLELQYEAARLRAKIIGYFVKQQKRKLSALLDSTEEAGHTEILSQVRELDKMLKQIKET
ncbi:MAG TPA: DNA primase [Patescibacteria group bacterium]|nr:DNA primase [Patescibacteria group bacterium]